VSLATINLSVACLFIFVVVVVYFIIHSVHKLLDTPSYEYISIEVTASFVNVKAKQHYK
jgi:hypothetical protein